MIAVARLQPSPPQLIKLAGLVAQHKQIEDM